MPLYQVGQIVYAAKTLITDACGDHPAFLHARPGDRLVVLGYEAGTHYPYSVADNPEGRDSFRAMGKELMGQKPFEHNYS